MALSNITPAEAATELLRRRRARESLVAYSQAIEIPGAPVSDDANEWLFKPIETKVAKHHIVTMEAIEACIRQPYGRLMIFEPPGSAKSTYASVVGTTWAMGAFPGLRVLMTSYAGTPIVRHSKRGRQIVGSRQYRSIWPDDQRTELVAGSTAADEWELTNGSGLFAAGLLGGITSSRCFPAGTLVDTPAGLKPIETLAVGDNVVSYDLERNCYTVRQLIATRAIRHEGQLVEVATTGGRRVRCTPEHRVYTQEHGYREASLLGPGNTVLRSSEVARLQGVPGVLQCGAQGAQRRGGMFRLWQDVQAFSGSFGARLWRSVLQRRVPSFIEACGAPLPDVSCVAGRAQAGGTVLQFPVLAGARQAQDQAVSMPRVRKRGDAKVEPYKILLSGMREPGARGAHGWLGKLALQGWQQLCRVVSAYATDRDGAGWFPVRCLYDSTQDGQRRHGSRAQDEPSSASLRRGAVEQSSREPDYAMPAVPRPTSCETDTVSVVARVGGEPVTVYDLQVEGTECFFAGSFLVHNCDLGIIDDPVAGREEAESETMRRKTRAAYEDDFLTRLKPSASVILIQTRWHLEDLAGTILPEDYDGRSGPVECRDGMIWNVLNIPAQCEREDDPVGRQIGEYLWPEWFGPEHWAIYQMRSRTWSALYQQRPVPETGGHFERSWFQWYEPHERPPLNLYGASDYAVSEKRGDFTEHGVAGEDKDGHLWLVDWWRGQENSEHTLQHFLDMVGRNRPRVWFGERGVIEAAIGPARDKFMREDKLARRVAIELLPTMGDKIARVASFRARAQLGMVHLPKGAKWAEELAEQLCTFPYGRHDDGVDVCGLLGRGIDQMRGAAVPEAEKRKTLEPFTTAWLHANDQQQTVRPGYYR